MKLEEIREVTEYKVPISIKVGAARIANDVRIAAKAGVDAIVFDGMEGGTAASPTIQLDHAGIPTVAAIAEASEALADMGKKDTMKIIVGGGIRNGADAAKCIALGADVVYLGTAPIIAMGCHKPIYLEDYARLGTSPYECQHCHTGLCPVGITTQLPKLMERLDVDEAADSVTNYLNAHHHGDPALRPRLRQEPGERPRPQRPARAHPRRGHDDRRRHGGPRRPHAVVEEVLNARPAAE